MKRTLLNALPAVCLAVVCPVALADADADASIPLELRQAVMTAANDWDGLGTGFEWDVSDTEPFEIAWCEDDQARMEMTDSAGKKALGVKCRYFSEKDEAKAGRTGSLKVQADCWKASPGAWWVRMQGTVPFVVARNTMDAAPVEVNLQKGFSLPVVLKDAALRPDGQGAEDVTVKLVVDKYAPYGREWAGKDTMDLYISIYSPVRLGVGAVVLKYEDGDLRRSSETVEFGRETPCSGGFVRRRIFMVRKKPADGKIKLVINHAVPLQRVQKMVDAKVTLSGLMEGEPALAVAGEAAVPDSSAPSANTRQHDGAGPVVETTFLGMAVNCGTTSVDERQAVRGLMIRTRLSVQEPLSFGDGYALRLKPQTLSVTDSTGHELPPAVFEMRNPFETSTQHQSEKTVYVNLKGVSPDLASPGSSWVRLHGMLRVPVSVVRVSDPYDLGMANGWTAEIPLPGRDAAVADMADAGDVATVDDGPVGTLLMKEARQVERQGKTCMYLKLTLTEEGTGFDLVDFMFCDDQGKPLKSSWEGKEASRKGSRGNLWGESVIVEPPGEGRQIKLRLRYRAGVEMKSVPVDMKVGMEGEIVGKSKEGAGNKPS